MNPQTDAKAQLTLSTQHFRGNPQTMRPWVPLLQQKQIELCRWIIHGAANSQSFILVHTAVQLVLSKLPISKEQLYFWLMPSDWFEGWEPVSRDWNDRYELEESWLRDQELEWCTIRGEMFFRRKHRFQVTVIHVALPAPDVVRLLLHDACSIDKNLMLQIDSNGFSALHTAAMFYPESFELLFNRITSEQLKLSSLRNLIHCACYGGQKGTVILLLQRGVKAFELDAANRSVLYYVSISAGNSAPCVQVLFENLGKEVFNQLLLCDDDEGCLPLHLAASRNNVEVVRSLLHWGTRAALTHKDRAGLLASEAALRLGYREMFSLLAPSETLSYEQEMVCNILQESRKLCRIIRSHPPLSSFRFIEEKELELQRYVDEGGFGAIYSHKWEGMDVAVKELTGEINDDTTFVSEVAFLLTVQGIDPGGSFFPTAHGVSVVETDDARNAWAIVMQLIEGPSLKKWLDNRPSLQSRIVVFVQLVQALALLHECGIRHNDLSVNNVLVVDDTGGSVTSSGDASDNPDLESYPHSPVRPVLIDFGLSCFRANPTDTRTSEESSAPSQISTSFGNRSLKHDSNTLHSLALDHIFSKEECHHNTDVRKLISLCAHTAAQMEDKQFPLRLLCSSLYDAFSGMIEDFCSRWPLERK